MHIPPFFIKGVTRRDCPLCGSEYLVHHAMQIYCSNRCRVRANRRKYPNGRPAEITRVGPATGPEGGPSVSSHPLPLAMPHNQFSTMPSTAEQDILDLWSKKKD